MKAPITTRMHLILQVRPCPITTSSKISSWRGTQPCFLMTAQGTSCFLLLATKRTYVLIRYCRTTNPSDHRAVAKTKNYIRSSFLDPSKDSRTATPDQSPERRRGQVDKVDSMQADAAQWNRVVKWLKSIGQTKYAESFKRQVRATLQ